MSIATTPEVTVLREYTAKSGPAAVVDILGEGPFIRFGEVYYRQCWKCEGTGYLPGYEFSDNARCWACGTRGHDHKYGPFEKARAAAKRRIATRKRQAAESAKLADAARAKHAIECPKWREANADLVAFAESVDDVRALRDYELARIVEAVQGGGYLDGSDTRYVRRHLDREAEKVARAAASGWIGNVGERVELTVEIVKIIDIPDYYSYQQNATKPLYILRDGATGNELVWFASSWGSFAVKDESGQEGFVDEGDVVTVKATVKEHRVSDRDFNQGLKQTVVTRVKAS